MSTMSVPPNRSRVGGGRGRATYTGYHNSGTSIPMSFAHGSVPTANRTVMSAMAQNSAARPPLMQTPQPGIHGSLPIYHPPPSQLFPPITPQVLSSAPFQRTNMPSAGASNQPHITGQNPGSNLLPGQPSVPPIQQPTSISTPQGMYPVPAAFGGAAANQFPQFAALPATGLFPGGPQQYGMKQPVFMPPQSIPQQQQPHAQLPTQSKQRNSRAIKIINPETKQEVNLDNTPPNSRVSSASSSSSRFADPTDQQAQQQQQQQQGVESDRNVQREFKEKVRDAMGQTTMGHAPNAIIKSPTERQPPLLVAQNSSPPLRDEALISAQTSSSHSDTQLQKHPEPVDATEVIPLTQQKQDGELPGKEILSKSTTDDERLVDAAAAASLPVSQQVVGNSEELISSSDKGSLADSSTIEQAVIEKHEDNVQSLVDRPTSTAVTDSSLTSSPGEPQSSRIDGATSVASSTDNVEFDRQPQLVESGTSSHVNTNGTLVSQAEQSSAPHDSSSTNGANLVTVPHSSKLVSKSLPPSNSPESQAVPAQDYSSDHIPISTGSVPFHEHPPQSLPALVPSPPSLSPPDNDTGTKTTILELSTSSNVEERQQVAVPVEELVEAKESTEKEPLVKEEKEDKERSLTGKGQDDRPRSADRKGTRKPLEDSQLQHVKPDPTQQIETDSDNEESEEMMSDKPVINGAASVSVGKDDRGRFRYDRAMLLSYRGYSQPPKDLDLSILGRINQLKGDLQQPFGGPQQGRQKRPGQGMPRKVITHQPNKEVKVELRKAENRWVRPVEVEGELSEEERETKEIFRKFQGILNKLTPQKFKDLAEQALILPISNPERLKGCIDKIFTKALEEPNFSVAYANLCRVMSPIKVIWVTEEGKETTTTFRRELLTKCQKEFEKDKKDDEEREKMQKAVEEAETPELKQERQEQLEVWETSARKRSLGNIRFIGELFKLKMLSESIMHDCIVRLLRSSSDEESIECFCRLITTTGKEMDHEKGKQLMDKYFMRIEEIITKKKISARIKFMLQDVQETRENDWVPRRQESLKTIDQIHREAQQEHEQEQELIKHINIHTHPSMAKPNRGGGGESGDKKRGSKGSGTSGQQDEWRKDAGRRPEQKVDVSRLQGILRKGKDQKEPTALAPGGGFRPGGAPWSRKPVTATPPPEQSKSDKPGSSKGPLRTSSGGSKRTERGASGVSSRNSQQGVRRGVSGGSGVPRSGSPIGGPPFNNRSEKESAVNLVKQLSHPHEPEPAQLQRELTQQKAVDKLDEDTITRKSHTIVDELTNNKDFKESIQCVEEMDSPSKMNVFIRESIFHALEKSSLARTMTGDLLHQLVGSNILSQEQMSGGLSEVLELAEDLEVDIPLFWDYFAECVCMMVAESSFPLSSLAPLAIKGCALKAPRCVAKVITHCAKLTSPEMASKLWAQSGLSWAELGVDDSNIAKFLETETIRFLQVPVSQDTDEQHFLTDLVRLLRTEKNDDILSFIEKRIPEQELKSPPFVRTLAEATIRASTTEGPQVEFNADRFRTLSVSLRKYADEDDVLQVEILNAAQVTVAKLNHPPGLLHNVFYHLYDVETIKETTFIDWLKRGTEDTGRGVALQSVKGFFDWLENADPESDNESGT